MNQIKVSALTELTQQLQATDFTLLSSTGVSYKYALFKYLVKNSGDESITGIKTFISSPIVPTPTTDTQASTKKFVDDSIINLGKGLPNGIASLGSDGKVPSTELPQLVITDTFVVADEAAMLALTTAEQGDIAIRTDNNKTFILQITPSSTLDNWKELRVSTDPNTPTSDQKAALVGNDGTPSALNPYATDSALVPLESFKLYSATYTYALNEPCFYLGVPYKSLSADNIDNTPSTSPLSWEVTGGGAGSGDAGYTFDNGQFEASTVGWSTYDDGAVAIPVDGTGGSPTVTFARSATSPLVGTGSAVFLKDFVDQQGQGVSKDFTIDRGLTGTPAQIKFLFETGGEYNSADMKLYIIETSTNTIITPNVVDIPTSYGVPQVFITNFFPIKDKTAYRLCWHVASVSVLAFSLKLDDITVGSKETIVAPAISDWQAYTPTFQGFGTPTAVDFKWRRNGSNIDIDGIFNSGVPTAEEARIGFPEFFTSRANLPPVSVKGKAERASDSTTFFHSSVIVKPSVAYLNIGIQSSVQHGLTIQNGSGVIAAGNMLSITASIPCAQFSVNTSFNGMNEPMYLANSNQTVGADDTGAGTVSGMDGALIPAFTTVQYRDVILPRAMQPNEVWELRLRSKVDGSWHNAESFGIESLFIASFIGPWHIATSLGYLRTVVVVKMASNRLRVYFPSTITGMSSWNDGATIINRAWSTIIASADGIDRWCVRIGQAGLSEVKPSVYVKARITANTAAITNNNPIPFATIDKNYQSALASTGVFTAPVTGKYLITVCDLSKSTITADDDIGVSENGILTIMSVTRSSSSARFISFSTAVELSSGQTAFVYCGTTRIFTSGILTITRIGD